MDFKLILLVCFALSIAPTEQQNFRRRRAPVHGLNSRTSNKRIYAVTDLDADSARPDGTWVAYLKEGTLTLDEDLKDPNQSTASITWDDSKTRTMTSTINAKGRGMELSTLSEFEGKLYACDDKTGTVFELPIKEPSLTIEPIPWVKLADGNGQDGSKGFKCEWSTIKDGHLWIGGHGSKKKNNNEKWIKIISPEGEVQDVDWAENFNKIMAKVGITEPGYITNEAVDWNSETQKWVFLPRRVSPVKFDASADSYSSSNLVIIADPSFENIEVKYIGDYNPIRAFSDFKFISKPKDVVVALKSVEIEDDPAAVETYATVLDLRNNHTLMPEIKFDSKKYEGVELVKRKK